MDHIKIGCMQGSSLIQVVLRNYQVRALLLEWTKTIITGLVCIFTCDLGKM
ncbi:unnamed protein product, partial [Musa acuminata subsp. burmannicoides]